MFATPPVYHVQPGDTLSTIAAAHGTSWETLWHANPEVTDPNLIYTGEVLQLPAANASPSSIASVYHGDGDGDHDSDDAGTASPAPDPAPVTAHSGGYQQPSAPSATVSAPANTSGNYSGSDLASVPGVPRSFAACVALRESSNGTNAAYNGGVYGIIRASGLNVNGQSLAAQKAAFAQLYREYGNAPWTPSDHC